MSSNRTCTVDGCGRSTLARGLCGKHYQRWQKSVRVPPPCSIEGCGQPAAGRGWCDMHLTRWKRHGDPLTVLRWADRVCSIEGCGQPAKGRGWCATHYGRWQRNGDPLKTVMAWSRSPEDGQCTIEGCGREHYARGWCMTHYERQRKHGVAGGPIRVTAVGKPRTYQGAHVKVWRERGKASAHECVSCGQRARHWAYDGRDPDEMIASDKPMWISWKPEHYQPMCLACHRALDRELAKRRAREAA